MDLLGKAKVAIGHRPCPRATWDSPSPPSDHPVHRGGGDHTAAHLPPQEDPHCHRAHQGGKQVWVSPRPQAEVAVVTHRGGRTRGRLGSSH